MDRFDRIYSLHQELRTARRPVSHRILRERLECSRATLNRIIEDMRNFLGAPIVYSRGANGYHYTNTGEHPYELPGLWFNAAELHALLATQRLLDETQPGLLEPHLAPLRERIENILETKHLGGGEITRRVRILKTATRRVSAHHFQIVAGALTQRKGLHIHYHDRQQDKITERNISPQRLVHYRDNWYLDAWCHLRDDLRTFSLDRIQTAHTLDQPTRDIDDARLDAYYTRTYGIFAGEPAHIALLRFTPERARWVADEQWHPAQEGRWLEDGYYELRIPYGDPRELIMDILKHGSEVEVIEPRELRQAVIDKIRDTATLYSGGL